GAVECGRRPDDRGGQSYSGSPLFHARAVQLASDLAGDRLGAVLAGYYVRVDHQRLLDAHLAAATLVQTQPSLILDGALVRRVSGTSPASKRKDWISNLGSPHCGARNNFSSRTSIT